MLLGALCLRPDPSFLCCRSACLRCCSTSFRFLYSLVPVRHLGLKLVILTDESGDPDPQSIHLLGLGERPDRWNDLVRSYPQLGVDLIQRLLHGLVLTPGLSDALCYVGEWLLHPFLPAFRLRTQLLCPRLQFWWNRA